MKTFMFVFGIATPMLIGGICLLGGSVPIQIESQPATGAVDSQSRTDDPPPIPWWDESGEGYCSIALIASGEFSSCVHSNERALSQCKVWLGTRNYQLRKEIALVRSQHPNWSRLDAITELVNHYFWQFRDGATVPQRYPK